MEQNGIQTLLEGQYKSQDERFEVIATRDSCCKTCVVVLYCPHIHDEKDKPEVPHGTMVNLPCVWSVVSLKSL